MSDAKTDDKKQKKMMNIKLEDSIAKGVYSNNAFVMFNQAEFVLDFIYTESARPQGHVVSRVITNPQAAKKLAQGLNSLLKRYESTHGPIALPGGKEQSVDKKDYN